MHNSKALTGQWSRRDRCGAVWRVNLPSKVITHSPSRLGEPDAMSMSTCSNRSKRRRLTKAPMSAFPPRMFSCAQQTWNKFHPRCGQACCANSKTRRNRLVLKNHIPIRSCGWLLNRRVRPGSQVAKPSRVPSTLSNTRLEQELAEQTRPTAPTASVATTARITLRPGGPLGSWMRFRPSSRLVAITRRAAFNLTTFNS
jgi:hypothetical protein